MPQTTPIGPVILSGGSGTRLWPMSTPETPKQMLALTAGETMLQLTARRAQGALRAPGAQEESFAPPIVVANARHADRVEAQLAEVMASAQALILEPVGRNTAPAIALAAIAAGSGDAPLLVMPSDHVIADVPAFHAAIRSALPLVEQGWLVTFGIDPHAPETGYGWIRIGARIGGDDGGGDDGGGDDGGAIHRVAAFVEKPPRDRAEAMLAAGDHAWNGGIFLFRADAYLAALREHAPAILDACEQAMAKGTRDGTRIHPDAAAFAASPDDSIDYAVMEKGARDEHGRVAVVPVSMGWSDVGSWDALHEISDRDAAGNVHAGHDGGEVIAIDTANCLVRSDGARIAIVGVSDLIVVASGSDVLILPRGRSQEVRALIEAMKQG